jgi:PAS domain S-box-containing protein
MAGSRLACGQQKSVILWQDLRLSPDYIADASLQQLFLLKRFYPATAPSVVSNAAAETVVFQEKQCLQERCPPRCRLAPMVYKLDPSQRQSQPKNAPNMQQTIITLDSDPVAEQSVTEARREEALLKAGALQNAIFNSANFSSIATDEQGVIQIFNVGAERMLGYTAAEVLNRITPADNSNPQEVIETSIRLRRRKRNLRRRSRECRRLSARFVGVAGAGVVEAIALHHSP